MTYVQYFYNIGGCTMKSNNIVNPKTAKSAYPLRNKFVKLLHTAGMTENALDDVFVMTEHMSSDSLLKKLWSLSFSSSQESVLYDFKLVSKEYYANSSSTYIPAELIIPLRNELRFQYTLVHKDFLTINEATCKAYAPIFQDFVKEMGMDKILSAGLMILVLDFLTLNLWKTPTFVEKTLFLLKSSNGSYVHGGLRNIGLTQNEAQELSSRATAISKLMENIKSIAIKACTLPLSTEIFVDSVSYKPQSPNWTTPMARLGSMLRERGINLPDEPQTDGTENTAESDELESHENQLFYAENSSAEINATVPTIIGTIAENSEGNSDNTPQEVSSTPNIISPRTNNLENAFRAVTPQEVIQNMDILKEFIHVADEVAYAGFSVKEVLEKLSAIRKFLDGFEALS